MQEQDLNNTIDRERRKANLSRKIHEYTEDIHRQVKTKEGIPFHRLKGTGVCYSLITGIENLKKVYHSTPDFCDEKALEDVTRQLYEVPCITFACFLSKACKALHEVPYISCLHALNCFLSRPIITMLCEYAYVCVCCNDGILL